MNPTRDFSKLLEQEEKAQDRDYRIAAKIVSAIYTAAVSLTWYFFSHDVAVIALVYVILLNLGMNQLYTLKKVRG